MLAIIIITSILLTVATYFTVECIKVAKRQTENKKQCFTKIKKYDIIYM